MEAVYFFYNPRMAAFITLQQTGRGRWHESLFTELIMFISLTKKDNKTRQEEGPVGDSTEGGVGSGVGGKHKQFQWIYKSLT